MAAPATVNYTDTIFVDTFATKTSTLVGSDVDANTTLTYGISGGTDNGTTVSKNNAYGTLTVTKATGAYSFVANSTAIEPLAANTTDSTLSVTVSDGSLTASRAFTVSITQSGITESIGDNSVTGTAGADHWAGLAGNDTYTVNNAGDVVTEQVNEGWDSVYSSISYTLSANVEALVLTGIAAINATGNSAYNYLVGNSAANTLDGQGGADFMVGGLGNDTYNVDNAGDTIIEYVGEGWDTVWATSNYVLGTNVDALWFSGTANLNGYGNFQTNYLVGNSGNNSLDGQGGADTMLGGLGNDSYYVDNAGDVVTENAGQGTDTIYASLSYALSANVENLILTGVAAIGGYGNAAVNTITGNSGDNIINGGAGADSMAGGTGNDIYYVDNVGDTITENASAGWDSVYSTVSYTLSANVDALVLMGTAAINATGNAGYNYLVGNRADNIFDAKAGADFMVGGAGNDSYNVDNTGDMIIEYAGEGWDTIWSSSTYALGANVDALLFYGSANLNGYGNGDYNYLVGNTGDNLLDGQGGNDYIIGGEGADILVGSLGQDHYDLTETVAVTDTLRVATGDSLAFIGGYDFATGFKLGTSTVSTAGVDKLDLASTTIAANTAAVNGINSGAIASHSINNGIISFDDINNFTTPITLTDGYLPSLFSYLQANITGSNTVAFVAEGNTFVFQDGGVTDTLVELVGVSASSLNTTGLAANAVWIA